MTHSHLFSIAFASFCGFLLLASLISDAQEVPSRPSGLQLDRDNYIIPPQPSQFEPEAPPQQQNQTRVGFLPQVTVNGSGKDENRVGVHVPFIFDMTNSVAGNKNQTKLDLSVLSGLVTVNKDRQRDPMTGQVSGPLTVTVFGIPVYTGKASAAAGSPQSRSISQNTAQARDDVIENLVDSRQAVINDGLRSAADQIQNTLTSTNEKVLTTLTSLVDRLTTLMKRPLQDTKAT